MPQKQNPQQYTGLGAQQYIYGPDDFVLGMTSSDFSNDGGFSSRSRGIDIYSTPGVVLPTQSPTVVNTSASDYKYVASCEALGTPYVRMFVGSNGSLYSLSTTPTLALFSAEATKVYNKPTTDIVQFNGKFYYSSTTNITEVTAAASVNATWFSGTSGGSTLGAHPHPLLVFNKSLFVADGNLIKAYNLDSNTSATVLTLSADVEIIGLTIDPSSGLMMVAVSSDNGLYGRSKAVNYVGLYDGFNPTQFRKKIFVDERVTAMYNLGGQVYMVYGQNLGVWNGTGIQFLRRLTGSLTIDGSTQLDKHLISNMGNVLLIADTTSLITFGEVEAGKKVFSTIYLAGTAPTVVTCVGLAFGVNVGYSIVDTYYTGSASVLQYTSIVTNTSGGTGRLVTKIKHFDRPKFIRALDVFMNTAPTTGTMTITGIGDDISSFTPGTGSFAYTDGVKKRFTFNKKTTNLQFTLNFGGMDAGIRKVVIYYDNAE